MKPLAHLRVVEFATVGGVPLCAWWLAQWAAHFSTLEACVTPALSLRAARADPVNRAAFDTNTSDEAQNMPRTALHLSSIA